MDSIDVVDSATILSGQCGWIESDLLETLARHPLDCIGREFPHSVRSIDSADGIERPAERHPVFYGCFDWHSAVHSHWCLIRQLRLFDDHPAATEIERRLSAGLTTENVEREVAYLEANRSFERPYGWAWLLRLTAELWLCDDEPADDWLTTLRPIEHQVVTLVETEFLSQKRPFRVGTHGNTAFALQAVIDYARVTSNDQLLATAEETARDFYLEDRDYAIEYEPYGWDFVSPGLVEADLMRRVLAPSEFASWLDRFLPDLATEPSAAVLEPVPTEGAGGVRLHLVGLNLSKAWCLAGIAGPLDGHRYHEVLHRSAVRHAERGLDAAFTEEYAGAHWLSSFVLYLLTRNEGGIASE